jgi:hypothetical protein
MTDPSFTPTFHHVPWVDNVDRVQAGGLNGFNIRFDAIGADLRQVSTVVDQIDDAIDALRDDPNPPQPTTVLVPLQVVSTNQAGFAPGGGWGYDEVGAISPGSSIRGNGAVMDLDLPNQAVLVSFRVRGLFSGDQADMSLSLSRASIADPTRAVDVLGTVTDPGTNPYDITVTVDARFATVDNGSFRYALACGGKTPPVGKVSLNTFQITYTPH